MSLSSSVFCSACGTANTIKATSCFACGHPLSKSQTAALIGMKAILRKRYRITDLLGQGGMGAVYKAEDTELGDRPVAIKEMSQRGMTQAEAAHAAQAFKREAHILAKLLHPNLPRIYDHFPEIGRWYLVMDFIEGNTVEDILNTAPQGKLPFPEVLDLGIDLCTVLEYLHTRQPPVIFRDLKPANIMRTPEHHLYLIDFGLARHFKIGQIKDTIAMGSPGYAAPEQYGRAQSSPRSDLYGLGATLHHLFTGEDPSENPFFFSEIDDDTIPEDFATLIEQLLNIHAHIRPDSAETVKQTLLRLKEPLHAPVVTLPSPSTPSANTQTPAPVQTQTTTPPPTTTTPTQSAPPNNNQPTTSNNTQQSSSSSKRAKKQAKQLAQQQTQNANQQLNTSTPATNQQPSTSTPITNQQPNTSTPATNQQPNPSTPVTNQQPSTSIPVTNQQPSTSTTPATNQQPNTSMTPSTNQQPAASTAPATTNQQSTTSTTANQQPAPVQQPGKQAQTVTTNKPPTTAQTTQQASSRSPQVAKQPNNQIPAPKAKKVTPPTLPTQQAKPASPQPQQAQQTSTASAVKAAPTPQKTAPSPATPPTALAPVTPPQVVVAPKPKLPPVTPPISLPPIEIGTTLLVFYEHKTQIVHLTWSPDGKLFASASRDQQIMVRDSLNGDNLFIYHCKQSILRPPHPQTIIWSPDSRRLASCYDRKSIYAWAAATGQRQFRCPHKDNVLGLCWSPDDKWLATITRHNITLWSTDNEDIIEHPNHLSQQAQTLAWSFDSTYLAASNRTGSIQIYSDLTDPYSDMKCVKEYRGHTENVPALAWAPEKHRLATAGQGQSVHVWNALTGRGVLIYQGHTASVTSLAWSPEGKLIASGSRDGTVRIWKANSGEHVFTYKKHSGSVTAVAWSPDGTCIASGDEHHRIHIWQAPS